ncbi:unnamed protein product, partial [Mycena citricolor]
MTCTLARSRRQSRRTTRCLSRCVGGRANLIAQPCKSSPAGESLRAQSHGHHAAPRPIPSARRIIDHPRCRIRWDDLRRGTGRDEMASGRRGYGPRWRRCLRGIHRLAGHTCCSEAVPIVMDRGGKHPGSFPYGYALSARYQSGRQFTVHSIPGGRFT